MARIWIIFNRVVSDLIQTISRSGYVSVPNGAGTFADTSKKLILEQPREWRH